MSSIHTVTFTHSGTSAENPETISLYWDKYEGNCIRVNDTVVATHNGNASDAFQKMKRICRQHMKAMRTLCADERREYFYTVTYHESFTDRYGLNYKLF